MFAKFLILNIRIFWALFYITYIFLNFLYLQIFCFASSFAELSLPTMKGWFDAFRDDGGPTLYSFSNRTPVTGDVSIVAVCVLFATVYIAFLVIFPGVRKQVNTSMYCTWQIYYYKNFIVCIIKCILRYIYSGRKYNF